MWHYFFIGTLMDTDVVRQVLGRELDSFSPVTAYLKDYKRVYVANATYPGLIPDMGSVVEGVLVQGVTEEEVACLDAFEGPEYLTQEVHVELREGGGGKANARAFIPAPSLALTDKEWSLQQWQTTEKHLFLDGIAQNKLV